MAPTIAWPAAVLGLAAQPFTLSVTEWLCFTLQLGFTQWPLEFVPEQRGGFYRDDADWLDAIKDAGRTPLLEE